MRILAPAWSSIRNKKYKDGSSHSPIWDPIYIFFLHGGEGLKYKLTLPPEQAIWKNLMGSLLERISFTLKEREIIFFYSDLFAISRFNVKQFNYRNFILQGVCIAGRDCLSNIDLSIFFQSVTTR